MRNGLNTILATEEIDADLRKSSSRYLRDKQDRQERFFQFFFHIKCKSMKTYFMIILCRFIHHRGHENNKKGLK